MRGRLLSVEVVERLTLGPHHHQTSLLPLLTPEVTPDTLQVIKKKLKLQYIYFKLSCKHYVNIVVFSKALTKVFIFHDKDELHLQNTSIIHAASAYTATAQVNSTSQQQMQHLHAHCTVTAAIAFTATIPAATAFTAKALTGQPPKQQHLKHTIDPGYIHSSPTRAIIFLKLVTSVRALNMVFRAVREKKVL